jgi:RNA polymerase sigma factor (sigma-70 family)
METQPTRLERTNDEWRAAMMSRDAEAWDELSRQLYTGSYKLVRRQLDRLTAAVWQEVAADSVQNAGVRIIERLDQYQGNGSFLAWCYVIVLNITRDRIRQERRRLRREEEELLDHTAPPQGNFAPRVEDQLFLDELAGQIYHFATRELSTREQKVFLALAQSESTPSELAYDLEITRNNVDQIWYRSRQKVRQHLERTGYTIAALRQHGIL